MTESPASALQSGSVQAHRGNDGVTGADDVTQVFSIPYGHAGRWQAPQIAAPTTARRKGLVACPQLPVARLEMALPGAFANFTFNEACLNLSVTAPTNAKNLPVAVWVHGGSYETGAGDMGVFAPDALAREQRVIVVSITYRLGLFGWLSGDGRPANLGALDVITALEWVQQNIAAFGGDARRITLIGQSSGGDLAARLMATNHAGVLFHRAIIHSAPLELGLGAGRMRRDMRARGRGLLPDAPTPQVLERQQEMQRAARRFGLAGQMPFGIEFGAPPFPPETDLLAAHAARAKDVDLMIGHTSDEAALFLPPNAHGARRILEGARHVAVAGLTRHLYARPARRFAKAHLRSGGRAARFTISGCNGAWGGAHLSDLPLLFPSDAWLGTPMVPSGMTLAELTDSGAGLRAIWGAFIQGQMPDAGIAGQVDFLTD